MAIGIDCNIDGLRCIKKLLPHLGIRFFVRLPSIDEKCLLLKPCWAWL